MYLVCYLSSDNSRLYRRYKNLDTNQLHAIIRKYSIRHKLKHVSTVKEY